MKSRSILLLSLIVITLFAYLSSFKNIERPSVAVANAYKQHISDLSLALDQLNLDIAKLDKSGKTATELKKSFTNARIAYKRVEFIMAWVAPEFVKDYINGAPLPFLEKNMAGPIERQPEGFQVMEEIIFSENPYLQKNALKTLSGNLKNYLSPLQNEKIGFTEMTVLEASRMGLIRLLSHGITGFDTPAASQNAINETQESLKSIHDAVLCFFPYVPKENSLLKDTIDRTFTAALNYLKNNKDFDSFDRTFFVREYINPLYGSLLDLHLILNYETVYDVKNDLPAINFFERTIFSNDFLDTRFFTKLKSSTDKETIELGKMLFFDPILSSNNQRSCASCHNPAKGFTDGVPKSVAYNFEGTIERNAPTLINAAYANRYFYDLRADFLEKQVDHVVVNHQEFNTSFPDIIKKLQSSPEYNESFKKKFAGFGEHYISKNTISSALAAYVASLKGFNSEFDKYMRKEIPETGADVKRGFNLFMGKAGCGSCHFAPVFNGTIPPLFHETESEVLGTPATANLKKATLDKDIGRAGGMLKENTPIYKHSFKTPTIRNIAVTAPYMHNGAFKTLEEVMDFYNEGGGQGIGLDVPNQTLPSAKLGLSKKEIKDIIAFMSALTDTTSAASRPSRLPAFPEELNFSNRKIGGDY
jgi:cytochrome c peroxidase